MVTPDVFEALLEQLAERDLTALVKERLARRDSALEVDIDSI